MLFNTNSLIQEAPLCRFLITNEKHQTASENKSKSFFQVLKLLRKTANKALQLQNSYFGYEEALGVTLRAQAVKLPSAEDHSRIPGERFSEILLQQCWRGRLQLSTELPPSTGSPPGPRVKPFSPPNIFLQLLELLRVTTAEMPSVEGGALSNLQESFVSAASLCTKPGGFWKPSTMLGQGSIRQVLRAASAKLAKLLHGSHRPQFHNLLLGTINSTSFSKSPLSSSTLARKFSPQTLRKVLLATTGHLPLLFCSELSHFHFSSRAPRLRS